MTVFAQHQFLFDNDHMESLASSREGVFVAQNKIHL